MHKIMKAIQLAWLVTFFLGVPAGLTIALFSEKPSGLSSGVIIFFVLSTFLTSFENVFLKHQEYHVFSQIFKMLLSIYIAIVGFAAIYKQEGLISGGTVVHDASSSLYFSVVTWTTLGYGDFQPTESVRWLAALEALLGTLFIPLFLASILFIFQLIQSHNQASKGTQ